MQAAYHPMLRAVLRALRWRTDSRLLPVAICSPCLMVIVTSLTVSTPCSCHPWMGRVPASKYCVPRRKGLRLCQSHSAATPGAADALLSSRSPREVQGCRTS